MRFGGESADPRIYGTFVVELYPLTGSVRPDTAGLPRWLANDLA
jgi:hypothetical protein